MTTRRSTTRAQKRKHAADELSTLHADDSSSAVAVAAAGAVAASSPTTAVSAPLKRSRRSFTELAQGDTITLPLVFSYLDIYSLLRSRRACVSWAAASRRAVTWQHCHFTVNLEHATSLPVSSARMLRHLCLVRSLK